MAAHRNLSAGDLSALTWVSAGDEGWRIHADVTCAECGAYQATDSDPTRDRDRAIELAVRLFNHVGWRVGDAGRVRCPDCAAWDPT